MFTFHGLQNKLKSVSKSIAEIEEERVRGDPNLDAISHYHEKIQQDGKLTPVSKVRLKSVPTAYFVG